MGACSYAVNGVRGKDYCLSFPDHYDLVHGNLKSQVIVEINYLQDRISPFLVYLSQITSANWSKENVYQNDWMLKRASSDLHVRRR